MRRHGPGGKPLGPDAYVFGNEVGEQIKSVRTAWRAACRRAGIENLKFQDLRREFGSRVHETGSSLHDVRDLLGHANISQTSTYLQSTPKTLNKAIERKEAHEREQAEARRAREQSADTVCHTDVECGNGETPSLDDSASAEVVKH